MHPSGLFPASPTEVIRLATGIAVSAAIAAGAFLAQACGRSSVAPSPMPDEGCSNVVLTSTPCDEPTYIGPLPFNSLPCPSREEIQQVRSEITITVKSDPSEGTLACREADGSVDLTPVQFLVYRALLFLRGVRFESPLPWTDKTVYDWLRSTIPKGIVIDSVGDSHSCLSCPGPITLSYDAGLWARNQFDRTWPSLPFETILHEARHAQGWNHTCNWVGNRYARDRAVSEMGASATGYYLHYWLAYHSHEDPLIRSYSKLRAAQYRQNGLFCCECKSIVP